MKSKIQNDEMALSKLKKSSNKNNAKNSEIKLQEIDNSEKYTLILKTIDNIYLKMDKMDDKLDSTVRWVSNMCIATILGIVAIVISIAAIAFTLVNRLLK